jgi:hypothetical protein
MPTIRTLTPEEAGQAVDWAAAEGWNPGLVDLDCFLAQDPGLFLGAFEGDEMVSVISATRYEPRFGFIGFYIARPEARGRGHGIAVWRAAMAQLAGRLVGLDGVVAQQANYRKSGFTLAWKNIRYSGDLPSLPAPRELVVPAATVPFAALEALDATVFPAQRPDFLRAWIGAPGHVALVVLRGGAAVGFGVVRECRTGHKIGPLIAEDAAVADALVTALTARCGAGPFYIDVPETNPEAVRLAERLAMQPVFETARMYTGPAPHLVMNRLFGVASFELG